MVKTYGAFALDPLYNGLQRRKVRVCADVEYILSPEEIASKSVEELNEILQEQFSFDNFKWHNNQGMIQHITPLRCAPPNGNVDIWQRRTAASRCVRTSCTDSTSGSAAEQESAFNSCPRSTVQGCRRSGVIPNAHASNGVYFIRCHVSCPCRPSAVCIVSVIQGTVLLIRERNLRPSCARGFRVIESRMDVIECSQPLRRIGMTCQA